MSHIQIIIASVYVLLFIISEALIENQKLQQLLYLQNNHNFSKSLKTIPGMLVPKPILLNLDTFFTAIVFQKHSPESLRQYKNIPIQCFKIINSIPIRFQSALITHLCKALSHFNQTATGCI